MNSTALRSEVIALVRTKPERAVALARTIKDGWFRCQSLAWVARYASDSQVAPTLEEAVQAAAAAGDAYRQLTVTSWPIRAAIERGRGALADRWIRACAGRIPEVEPMPSRAECLWWLWAASFPGGERRREPILKAILAHCPPDRSWRAERLYRYAVATLAAESPAAADDLIATMPEGRARTRIARRRAAGELGGAQPFFW